jgi:FkbM family methyltransferase
LFLFLIAYRLAGHLSVKLPVEFVTNSAGIQEYYDIERPLCPSELNVMGMFGKLNHYDFFFKGHRYVYDGLSLEEYLFRRQYCYCADGVTIGPASGDVVIDGGAFLGDSALVFSNAVGDHGKVYAFDPVVDHQRVIEHNIKQFPIPNVVGMPYGLSDKNSDADLVGANGYSPGFFVGDTTGVPLRTIDSMVNAGLIERIDFIKLDIEGSELAALRGARESIHRLKPKLAICIYHKPNDLFDIIIFITENFPFYTLYIGHYSIHAEETVLYCKPAQGSLTATIAGTAESHVPDQLHDRNTMLQLQIEIDALRDTLYCDCKAIRAEMAESRLSIVGNALTAAEQNHDRTMNADGQPLRTGQNSNRSRTV